jgi:hypothetical protein
MAPSAKPTTNHGRLRIRHDQGMGTHGLEDHPVRQRSIGPVSDAHRYDDTGGRVGQGPVDNPIGNEDLVRHDQLALICIGNGRRPDANARDGAGEIADRHHITHPDRLLEQ